MAQGNYDDKVPVLNRILAAAQEYGKNLQAGQFKNLVRVHHEDGTDYLFDSAFAVLYFDKESTDFSEHPGQWLFVFTEHHGIHYFHIDDLARFEELERVGSPIRKHPDHPGYQFICEDCEDVFVGVNKKDGRLLCPNGCLIVGEGSLVRKLTEEEKIQANNGN